MKILFLCTAHNSLSQRLYLDLSPRHDITIEYALTDTLMISAAELASPDLIICPFLTKAVPKEVYNKYLTLIVHPGPPGDAGPSALDWTLIGDDGSIQDPAELLHVLDNTEQKGRTHWGVTVLQAIEQFDAGPVWAFEQFQIDIDQPGLTKSSLYRGPVSRAAIAAVNAAISRIEAANTRVGPEDSFSPNLPADPAYRSQSVTAGLPFQGGETLDRPLLKASQREFDVTRHTAVQISRRIRCGDSQPGSLSKVFGVGLYVYGGLIDESSILVKSSTFSKPGTILTVRNGAVCISTCDMKGIWISHVRRVKQSADKALWPKVPAVFGLLELGLLNTIQVQQMQLEPPSDWTLAPERTYQDVWVEVIGDVAYLYFEFYNGAMSTDQCSHLLHAMEHILSLSTLSNLKAVVLMGGAYFSNGIALNVIEASSNPSMESWDNINRIDDIVHCLLRDFPARNILTVSAIRGNCAAGGVALATACDVVLAGEEVVLNPAYRGVGLFGSEYHTLSYFGRCGQQKSNEILRSMTPMSPSTAKYIGLVDHVLPYHGASLVARIQKQLPCLVKLVQPGRGFNNWKDSIDTSPNALARARAFELGEMAKDFFSARSQRYHTRRTRFVRKAKASQTPLRFAKHRRFDATILDIEERDDFDDVQLYENMAEQDILARKGTSSLMDTHVRKAEPTVESVEVKETLFSCYYKPVDGALTPPLEADIANTLGVSDALPVIQPLVPGF